MNVSEIKQTLKDDPETIQSILEDWDFTNVKIHKQYISFGRGEGGSPKSLALYYTNDYLGFMDFVTGEKGDIFSLIIRYRHLPFFEVITYFESKLGVEADYNPVEERLMFFGGIYDSVSESVTEEAPHPISTDKLNDYLRSPNLKFLNDGIGLKAQKKFNIRYDRETGNIIIPIYSPTGYLMGIKARVNRKRASDESKYYYVEKCQKNKTLYGYSQNYEYLTGADCIYVFEAEKSVMQAYTFGERRCVALGGSFLSTTQAKLLIDLSPKQIVLAMDKGLDVDKTGAVKANIESLMKEIPAMIGIEIGILDLNLDLDVPDKSSPTDLGKDDFYRIAEEDYIRWEND